MFFVIYSMAFCIFILYIVKRVFKWERIKSTHENDNTSESPKIDYNVNETHFDVMLKIPIYAYNKEDFDYENAEVVVLEPNTKIRYDCIILEGELDVFYKKEFICKKKYGTIIFDSLRYYGVLYNELEIKTTERTKVIIINHKKVNKFLLHLLFTKKCVEVGSKYFKLSKYLIKLEKDLFKLSKPHNKRENIAEIAKITRINLKYLINLENSMIFRSLHPGEIFKYENTCFKNFIVVYEGEICIESNSEEFIFTEGYTFGYFGLFFNIYTDIKIISKKQSKIGILTYKTFCDFGLNDEKFNTQYIKRLPPIFHLIDISCDWLCIKPGGLILSENTTPEHIYYISDGKIRSKSKEFVSGSYLGNKEAVLECKFKESFIAVKVSDIIKIPFSLHEYFFTFERSFYKIFSKMLFNQGYEKKGMIVTVIPSGKDVNIKLFSRRLKASIGKSCLLLSKSDLIEELSRKAFDSIEEQRFLNFPNITSRMYECIIIYLENEYSRLFKYLMKFTDTLLIVGEEFQENDTFDTYCQIEHVKLYEERRTLNGKNVSKGNKKCKQQNKLYKKASPSRIHHVLSPSRTILFCTKDYERLARFLLKKRIGLVLSGGAARGFAHVGVIQALEEEGIPIDVIGGTSMGAFIGALYARELDNSFVFKEIKKFCRKAGNFLFVLLDITYPLCSLFSGKGLNTTLKKIFKNELIQDLWIEFFCISTNISTNEEQVHRSGVIWKYLRTSMGLCGYLPPLIDNGSFLVDGGYMNNVPVDVMLDMNVEKVIAVDVGTILDNDYDDFGEDFNGFIGVLQRYLGSKKYMSMNEIQYRIAFLSSENKIRSVDKNDKVLFIKPDLGDITAKDFNKFEEIVASGYQSAKKYIQKWKMNGTFKKYLDQNKYKNVKRRFSV